MKTIKTVATWMISSNLEVEQGARLCQLILEENDGMAQQVIDDRHDLLDFFSKEELEKYKDDLGLTLIYLAVHYDRPDMLKYLHARGLNLMKPCDPMNYGNAMFYAVQLSKSSLIPVLDSLGCFVNSVCETVLNLKPLYYAEKTGNVYVLQAIQIILRSENNAGHLLLKHYLRKKQQIKYLRSLFMIISAQKYWRGYLARKRFKKLQSGEEELNQASTYQSASIESKNTTKTGMDVLEEVSQTKEGSVEQSVEDDNPSITEIQSQDQSHDPSHDQSQGESQDQYENDEESIDEASLTKSQISNQTSVES